jgi:hypothetical protein
VVFGRNKYTDEPLVPVPSSFKVEIATGKLKKYKSPGSDQILAELVKTEGKSLWSDIYKRKELPNQWKESITVPIYMKGDKSDGNIVRYHC